MRLLVLAAWVAAGGLITSDAPAEPESVWSKARAPAAGPALSIGSYSSGCVQGAAELPVPAQGGRYTVMKPERRRVFGHPQLIDFIVQLSARLEQRQLGPLGIGDLGQARGGPAPNGHASHQTGLDVDLWYEVGAPGAEQHSVVDLEAQKPSAYWSDRVTALLELAARDPHVARIFVNAVVKQQLCRAPQPAPGAASPVQDRGWLGKLRPWWGHNEHFHVRLACPTDSPECQAQPPLPAGDGCEELEWWLSPDTARDRNKGVETYQKRVGAQPKLPDSCKKVATAQSGKIRSSAPAQSPTPPPRAAAR
jgi:penicillin-insensitive murein endopeptidase